MKLFPADFLIDSASNLKCMTGPIRLRSMSMNGYELSIITVIKGYELSKFAKWFSRINIDEMK